MEIKESSRPKCNYVVVPSYSKKDIELLAAAAKEGNIGAKIDIMMHNQQVVNYKLNELLKAQGEK